MTTTPAGEFPELLGRLERLLDETERHADPAVTARTRAVVRAVLDLHAGGLERILDRLGAAGDSGAVILDGLARDDVVSGLLLLHGLHPLGMEDRVRQALELVRPRVRAHGDVELIALDDGFVRLRLVGECDGCPSSSAAIRQVVEEAIYAKAPDVAGIEIEEAWATNGPARLALPVL